MRLGRAQQEPLPDRARALDELAALLRSGLSLHEALRSWPAECPHSLRPAVARAASRVALGVEPAAALRSLDGDFGSDGAALRSVVALTASTGGEVPALLDALARLIEQRHDAHARARAAVAGIKLSGRLVALLPLLCLALASAARAPLLDPTGVALLVAGALLTFAGVSWMGTLVPRPPGGDEPAAFVATVTAGALAGGVSLATCLDRLAASGATELPGLVVACRLVRLGASWSLALSRCGDEGLADMAALLARAESKGLPLRASLEAFARSRRDLRASEFEAAVRRAPVLMIVPLTLCVLPAFVLLGIVPLVRGLSLA